MAGCSNEKSKLTGEALGNMVNIIITNIFIAYAFIKYWCKLSLVFICRENSRRLGISQILPRYRENRHTSLMTDNILIYFSGEKWGTGAKLRGLVTSLNCRPPRQYKFEFSYVGNDRRPSQKSWMCTISSDIPDRLGFSRHMKTGLYLLLLRKGLLYCLLVAFVALYIQCIYSFKISCDFNFLLKFTMKYQRHLRHIKHSRDFLARNCSFSEF